MSPDDRGVQPPRVVLVTGASRFPGGFLVSRLVQDPSIERVVAVDAVSPSKDMMRRMGRAEFVRADIRNSLIGKVICASWRARRCWGTRGSRRTTRCSTPPVQSSCRAVSSR